MTNQRAVIRTVNGEIDDVWIENVDVHLERMDRDGWSLLLYRGDERIKFYIWGRPFDRSKIHVNIIEDELGCEREEQGE